MFNPKHGLSHLFGNAIPHCQEGSSSFAFVLGPRIFLSIAHKADALLQMPHEVEMILPCRIKELQQHRSLGLPHFRSENLFNPLQQLKPDLHRIHLPQIRII